MVTDRSLSWCEEFCSTARDYMYASKVSVNNCLAPDREIVLLLMQAIDLSVLLHCRKHGVIIPSSRALPSDGNMSP